MGRTLLARARELAAETAVRTQVWSGVLATALGIGAFTGAAQLGVGYGLGFLRLAEEVPTGGAWSARLTWVAWFAALAVLGGAAGGSWAARRYGLTFQLGSRIAVAVAAGLGAAVVAPLTGLPADSAVLAGSPATQTGLEAALTAGLGVVVGILAAVTALSVRLVTVSVALLAAAGWLLALVSVAPSLAPAADLPDVRLGVLDLPAVGGGTGSIVADLSPPLLALLVCGTVAAAARSRGLPPLSTAASSTAAPGLLALVYLIGTPGTGERAAQASPYAGALLAVAMGLLVSLVIGAVRMPGGPVPGDLPGDGDPTAGVPAAPTRASAAVPVPVPGELTRDSTPPLFPPVSPAPTAAPTESIPDVPDETPPEPPPEPVPEPVPEPAPRPEPLPDPEPEPAAAEPPAPAPKPSKRRRGPFRRSPEPEPDGEQTSDAGEAGEPGLFPEPAPEQPPATAPRPGKRGEDEHLDWISSLSGGSDEAAPEPGRRRLRPDPDPDPSTDP